MTPNLVDPDMELDVSNSEREELYSQHVNPSRVKLLDVLGLNVSSGLVRPDRGDAALQG
jgi:hypothetical protein